MRQNYSPQLHQFFIKINVMCQRKSKKKKKHTATSTPLRFLLLLLLLLLLLEWINNKFVIKYLRHVECVNEKSKTTITTSSNICSSRSSSSQNN